MRFLLATCLLAGVSELPAQTGPGGVGNSTSNVFWFDAAYGVTTSGSSVTTWADRSGNGNNASQATSAQQPAYVTGAMNGYPTVRFDNDQVNYDYLKATDNSTLEGMGNLTAFCVYQLATGTVESAPRAFFSKRNAPDNQEAYSWFIYNGGSGTTRAQYLDIDGTGNRLGSSTSSAQSTTCVNSFVYHGTAPSNAQNQTLYNGNVAVGNAAETSAAIPNYSSDLYLGLLRGHTGTGANVSRFNGDISEIILFNQALNDAQRTIINNYLAAKYGTTLATLDLYTEDDVANGNYDHDVAGIGRTAAASQQTDSRGTGLVRITSLSAADLNDGEFLFWGHDNGSLGTYGVMDKPASLQGRWQRVWRTNEVNTSNAAVDVGAVAISFDLTGQGPVVDSDLRLLVDTDDDGIFADETPIAGATAAGANVYTFNDITALTNGLRFTLGTINTNNTPLPIELLSFTATEAGPAAVRLDWSTATEHDNDHFTVERSTDASTWDAILHLPGAGTSQEPHVYQALDEAAVQGRSYYRLKQTDVDGLSTWSDVRSVHLEAGSLMAFPDPASESFSLALDGSIVESIQLINTAGQVLRPPVVTAGDRLVVDVHTLPSGLYAIVLRQGALTRKGTVLID